MVAEAIRTGPQPTYDDTGPPEGDLRTLLRARADSAAAQLDLVPGIITAMRDNEAVRAAVTARYTTQPFRDLLERVLGDRHPHLDVLEELVPALLLHHNVFATDHLDAGRFVDDVVSLITVVGGSARTT